MLSLVTPDEETIITALRQLDRTSNKDEIQHIKRFLVLNFQKLPPITKVTVCRSLKNTVLTQTFLKAFVVNQTLPPCVVEEIFVEHFQQASYEQLLEIIHLFLPNQEPERRVNVGIDGDDYLHKLVFAKVVLSYKFHPEEFRSNDDISRVMLYWCERLMASRMLRFGIDNILGALIETQQLTPQHLRTMWEATQQPTDPTHQLRRHFHDTFFNSQRAVAQRANQAFAPIIHEMERWMTAQLNLVGGNDLEFNRPGAFINMHDVHKLDRFRSKYLVWLYYRTKEFTDEDREVGKRLAQKYYQTYQGAREIQTTTSIFSTSDTSDEKNDLVISMSMAEIFENLLTAIMRLVPKQVDDEDERKKLLERRDLALKRMQDELIDMAGTCHSGHLNRLFNVTVGIFDNTLYEVIDYSTEARNLFQKHMQQLDEEDQDALFEGMADDIYTCKTKDLINKVVEKAYEELCAANVDLVDKLGRYQSFREAAESFFKMTEFTLTYVPPPKTDGKP
jgi:hypothetical protein